MPRACPVESQARGHNESAPPSRKDATGSSRGVSRSRLQRGRPTLPGKMPRARPVESHARCLGRERTFVWKVGGVSCERETPRDKPVASPNISSAWLFLSCERETPRDKPVASPKHFFGLALS